VPLVRTRVEPFACEREERLIVRGRDCRGEREEGRRAGVEVRRERRCVEGARRGRWEDWIVRGFSWVVMEGGC
jgi:hypothetical protein